MDTDGLFSLASPVNATSPTGFDSPDADSPLAVRMRPASIDELVGQEHLLAPGAPLRQLVTGDSPMSVILWGPPGTGKTTIAHLVAHATNRKFVALSALSAGVKDVRAVIERARQERRRGSSPTVLFIDEVHRFSKTQQDSLLAAVEDRTVTLLAATTENPYFSTTRLTYKTPSRKPSSAPGKAWPVTAATPACEPGCSPWSGGRPRPASPDSPPPAAAHT